MQFVIPQTQFSQALQEVSKGVATRPTHPILANIRLDADTKNQSITLTTTDLSLSIKITVHAQVGIEGSITVAHKLISDIVTRLPDEDVTFGLADTGVIDLKCGSGRYQLHGLPVAKFPELPTINLDDTNLAQISSNILLQGLAATLFASSIDETKRILTGVRISNIDGGAIEFAATDGHRLSVLNREIPEGDYAEINLTIPARSLREVERFSKAQEGAIAIKFDSANLIFATATKTVITRLLDGAYPNYRQLIPVQFDRQITLERKLFISALERLAVLADEKGKIVKLSIDGITQSVALTVEAPDLAAGREEVSAQISGEDIEIAFNIKYLLEGLKSFASSEIQLRLNTDASPAIIVPIGAAKQTYLLMPVQIRN